MSVSIYGSGQVPVQVVQTQKTSTFSSNSSSFVDITGLSVTITPNATTSSILVSFNVNISANNGGWFGSQMVLLRNGTQIAIGDANGSNSRVTIDFSQNTQNATLIDNVSMQWLDSPSTTSAVTYKLQMRSLQSQTCYVNQSTYSNGTASQNSQVPSTITAMEITGA